MTFTVTARHVANTGAGASTATITTDSQTPTASSLLLIFHGVENDVSTTNQAFQTPTGGGWTYTLVDKFGDATVLGYAGDGAFRCAAAMYRATISGSPAAHTITVDPFNNADVGWHAAVALDITGHSSATPVQTKSGGATVNPASSSAAGTLTLDATPAGGNLVVAAIFSTADSGGAFTTPTIGGQTMTPVTAQNNSGFTHAGLWHRVWTGAESSNVISCTDLGDNVGSYVIVTAEIPAAGGTDATATPTVVAAVTTIPAPTVTAGSPARTTAKVYNRAAILRTSTR